VPYLAVLERLLKAIRGAQGALMLDHLGEVVVEAGARDERHRLIGAYQGIALATAERTTERYAIGKVSHIVCRYLWATVILRPLKDGYYLILSMAPDASLADGLRYSAVAQEQMNDEL
jgi:predicted regulator of Ras-like GTPase activity (Roadblock/LC7/MglB family)